MSHGHSLHTREYIDLILKVKWAPTLIINESKCVNKYPTILSLELRHLPDCFFNSGNIVVVASQSSFKSSFAGNFDLGPKN